LNSGVLKKGSQWPFLTGKSIEKDWNEKRRGFCKNFRYNKRHTWRILAQATEGIQRALAGAFNAYTII